MSRRSTICGICRGSEFVDAIDSNGQPYRGCARCSVEPTPKPRRWRKIHPHEYTLRMGPVEIEVTRFGPLSQQLDEWGFRVLLVERGINFELAKGHATSQGAPLAQCQADAIAAVERWRDSIR